MCYHCFGLDTGDIRMCVLFYMEGQKGSGVLFPKCFWNVGYQAGLPTGPEFQYDEMKVRAENVLTSYLLAVDRMSEGTLKEGNKELKDKLEMRIGMLRGAGEKESFRSIKLHRTEITDYRKRNGRCIITFQTSLQYYYTRKDESGKILAGREDLPTQSKYNTDVIYIQDRELLADERDLALGLNCPNCGAPIPGTGSKVCEYCGTPVVELNIYAWTFGNVTEVR